MTHPTWIGPLRTLCLTSTLLALSSDVTAQAGVWIPLDGSPAGTLADVTLVPSQSSLKRTTIQVDIHGFWSEDVVGADGVTYQRLDFPGLETMHTPGEPELPEARMLLAMATDATSVIFDSAVVISQQSLFNINAYPSPIPGMDEDIDPTGNPGPGDTVGTAEQFSIDNTIYNSFSFWPGVEGVDGAVGPQVGTIPGASVASWPVSFLPASQRLKVKTSAQYSFTHPGNTIQLPYTLTKLKDKEYRFTFANWAAVQPSGFFVDLFDYHSRYLIIAQQSLWDTLSPFVKMKKIQGYEVTLDTPQMLVSSNRQIISNWYLAGDPGTDHFCLLVGDTTTIPLGTVITFGKLIMSDDVYGTVGAVNQSKEVYVGRLSIDSETDLANQLQKIISYQTTPVASGRYDTALLVSHEQEYPGKYANSQTEVLSASYSHPPSFLTSHGGTGATNQQVTNFITAGLLGDGLGLVAYRGHGSTATWSGWNLAGENWHSNDVIVLNNPVHPVVWAITCTNGNIDWGAGTSSDSIAEVWMEVPQGASASYAATRTTSTTPNHHLNETLFKVVYDWGITTHGMAIEAAEASLWANWPKSLNPWAYLLLGDPSMTIRRDAAAPMQILNVPLSLTLDDAGNEITLQAMLSSTGGPPSEGLFSYYKASFLQGEDDEMSGAQWMTAGGATTLNYAFTTPGTLSVAVRDEDGNFATQDITVGMGSAWTDLGNSLPGAGNAPAMAGVGSLQGNSPVTLLVTGADPGATAYLCFGATQLNAPFKGGVLVPDITPPGFVIPVPTDTNGNLNLSSIWPGGLPMGSELVMQAWFADSSGPAGFVASNGLLGRTP